MATDNVVNELIVNKLTQAQFDAIPETERSDTELYFITDAEIDGGKGAQVEEMPEATESNLGQIVQYAGETIQDIDTTTITQVVGNSLTDLKVDSKKFAEKLGITTAETVEFTHNINRGFNNTSDYIYPDGYAVSVVITNPTLLLTAVKQFLEHYPQYSFDSILRLAFDIEYSEEKSQNIITRISALFSDDLTLTYGITDHINHDLDEEHIGVVVGNEYLLNGPWSISFDILTQGFWKNDNIDVVLPSDGTIQFTTTKGNITFQCSYQSFIDYLTNTSIIPYNWKNEDIPEYLLKSSFTYNSGNNCWVYPPLAGIDDSWVRNFMQVSGDVQDGDSVEYVLTLPNEGNVITNIKQYGITYSGTPAVDDKIKIDYYPLVSGYEKGYFYINKEQLTSPEIIITQTIGNSLSNLQIDKDTFIKAENPTSDLTTTFKVASGGTRYEIEEKVGDYELSIDVSKVVAFAIDKLHSELKHSFLNGEQLRITIQDYRNQPDNSAYPWWVDIWMPSTGETINVGNRMATYWMTDIFGVDFDAESISDIGTLVFSCYYSEPTWLKNNDSQVTLDDYGISFNKGLPALGDVIAVNYKSPTPYGMSWEQINVQPSTGSASNIEWATILDVPADFPSNYRVGCTPIWSVPADLPDGTYEFYVQTLCGSESLVTVGLYNYTVKVLVKFYTEGDNRYYTGSISYVLDGSWTGDADHYPDNNDYYECFKINGDNLNFFIGSSPFYSTIPQYVSGVDIPGVFKISAWKNIDSGEQYIPEGTLYEGSYEGTNLFGSLQSYKLWPGLRYPSYYSNCTINLDPNYQYINFMPFNVLTGTFCQELEIYMKSSTGGEYHAVVKSQDWSCFIQECEASGDLANVQLGLNRINGSYIYINDKNNSVSQVEIQVSTSGMAHTDQEVYLQYFQDIVDDFIPLSVCKVGAPVTKRNLDKVLQYTQESTDEYTQGYFYKSSGTTVSVPASMEINWQSINGVEILIDAEKLAQTLSSHVGWDISYLKEDLLNVYYRWTYYEHESQPYVYVDFYGYFWDSDIAECFTINGELPNGYIEFQAGGYKDSSVEVINGKWEQINVQPVDALVDTHNTSLGAHENIRGIANGLATLDSNAKVPMSQINDSLLGNVQYQGLYDVSTNTPNLDTVETKGHYYIVSVAGDRFNISFEIGDWIISDGTNWTKVDNTDAVSSVNGRTGNVVITTEDLDLSAYVQKTDYANSKTAGLIKGYAANGFGFVPDTGQPFCETKSLASYNAAGGNLFVGKGTLETVKYSYVRDGIANNTYSLSNTEKEKVRNWIGAGVPTTFETMPDIYASAGKTYQYVGETTEEFISGYFYKSVSQGISYIPSDSNLTFDFDLFWSELATAGITVETLQMTELDKERGGFSIIGTVESETTYRVQDINGVQLDVLLTQAIRSTSEYVGANNRWYYKPSETFAWERVDVQPNTNMNIPAHPTTPGSYMLMCTVGEDGTANYSWETVA